uniref:Minor tail protein n=1 Tax=Myoviridae sp. ctlD98 TaxID=2827705 RepID=A0A8S5SA38_9CAUD|nr:MAG TPA: minor tail protein [Myoviridae sp. ctlD98]
MAEYDGEIRIKTKIDNADIQPKMAQVTTALEKSSEKVEKLQGKFDSFSSKIEESKEKIAEFEQKLEDIKNLEVPTEEYKKISTELEKAQSNLESAKEELQQMRDLGFKDDNLQYYIKQVEEAAEKVHKLVDAKEKMKSEKTAFIDQTSTDAYQKIIDKLNDQKQKTEDLIASQSKVKEEIDAEIAEQNRLKEIFNSATVINQKLVDLLKEEKELEAQIADMKKAGLTAGYDKYDESVKKLSEVREEIKQINSEQKKVGSEAKQIEKVGKSAKKASDLMTTFLSRFKGITLSLLVFNWITKGFNVMVAAFKEGIQNMAKYSDNFNSKMSEMKSAINTLKASLGTLAAPIVSAVVPAIVSLCNWLTTAINKINELIAALSGKSTWTKAKKQATDYAKSLDKTSGSAKKAAGALAAFDDLNVLQKNDSSGGSGSGVSDLYEEVPASGDLTKKLQPFLDYLKKTKASIEKGWSDTWKKLDISSQFVNIKTSAESIKNTLADIFTDRFVLASVDNFVQTVATSLGSMAASVTSIGATIAENFVGGMAIFLENNSWDIKGYIQKMFDVSADIVEIAAEGLEAFANVFSVFGDENGQQITANLIQIFADAFMMVTENAAKFARDIIDCIVTPFVENQDALKTALDGLLCVIADLTSTISDGVQHVTEKITELYDEHIHPFIENVKNGMSELIEKFLEFWNTYIQPILENLALMFEDTYENHLKPVFDNIIEIIGIVIDILNDLWTNILQPIIAWIIENILPIILPIIENLNQNIKDSVDFILDLINFLLSGIKLVFSALQILFTKDTDKVLRQTEKSVKNFVNSIIQMFENMVNRVINGINSLISGFNSIGFDLPDFLGGGSWHPSIPTIPTVSLPRLANGGITTGRTLAEIGEAGREAVLPLENNTGWMDDLAAKLASKMPDYSGAKKVVLAVDGKEFARINLPYLQDEEIRLGIAEG